MAASSQRGHSRTARKVWMLGAAVLIAIAAYSAGWFYVADTLKTRVRTMLEAGDAGGVSAECADMDVRGYPFRIGLFCSRISIDDHRNGISGSLGALRSAAQVYDPGHVVWELDDPVVVRAAPGITLSAEWSALQSSVRAGLDGLRQTSLTADNLKTNLISAMGGNKVNLDARHGEVHARENGPNLDAALTVEAVSVVLDGKPLPLPPLSASLDATLVDKAGFMKGRDDSGTGLRGSRGELRGFRADLGENRVMTLSGPFSFDEQGLMTGDFSLTIEKIGGWHQVLRNGFPDAARNIDTAANLLTGIANAKDGDKDNVTVKLAVNKGVISLAFIPLGVIPPV